MAVSLTSVIIFIAATFICLSQRIILQFLQPEPDAVVFLERAVASLAQNKVGKHLFMSKLFGVHYFDLISLCCRHFLFAQIHLAIAVVQG